jgi:hypothetical protein
LTGYTRSYLTYLPRFHTPNIGDPIARTTNLQNISNVLIKVHPRVESLGLFFNTTGTAVVSMLVSNEAAQLEPEVQILPRWFVNTRSQCTLDTRTTLPEAHTVFRDDRPLAHLTLTVLCDDRVPIVRVEPLDTKELAVPDILECPKAVSPLRKHPLQHRSGVSYWAFVC